MMKKFKVNLIPSIYCGNEEIQIICAPKEYDQVRIWVLKEGFERTSLMNGNGRALVHEPGKEPYIVEGPYTDVGDLLGIKPLVKLSCEGGSDEPQD